MNISYEFRVSKAQYFYGELNVFQQLNLVRKTKLMGSIFNTRTDKNE